MPKSKNRKKKKGHSCSHVKAETKAFQPIAKSRKRFLFEKFHLICKAAGSPDSIRLFTALDFQFFQLDLNKPFHIHFYEKERKIDNDFKVFLRNVIQTYLKNEMISYNNGEEKISLWDHLIYGETLAYLFRTKGGHKMPFRKQLMKELHHFENYVNTEEKVNNDLIDRFMNISTYLSTPDMGIFNLQLDYFCEKEKERTEQQTRFNNYRYCVISLLEPIKKRIITSQGPRLGYQLISRLSESGPIFFKTVFSLSELTKKEPKLRDVYISNHAVNRMVERLDCLDIRKALITVGASILLFLSKLNTDLRNHRRFPYYFSETKLGYFIYEIVGDDIFIQTFLFLTNEGTPEGNALSKKLGFSKYDKMYWNLGKLSTFLESDIYNVPEMKAILKACNCDQIPKIEKLVHFDEEHHYSVANKILDYMKKQKIEIEEFDEYLEYQ